jgi:hypothetical protein
MNIPDISYDWKALSIKQPAASMIVDGLKLVENRNKRQYKDQTLRGRWIFIHASLSSVETKHSILQYPPHLPEIYRTPEDSIFPRGMIIGIAKIKGVYEYHDIIDTEIQQWAHDGDACLLFDIVLKLNVPVQAPGGLNTWTMKPPSTWDPPRKLSKKESTMSPMELGSWRQEQENKYRKQSLKKRVALINILMAIRRDEYVVS